MSKYQYALARLKEFARGDFIWRAYMRRQSDLAYKPILDPYNTMKLRPHNIDGNCSGRLT